MASNNFYGLNMRYATNGIACSSWGAALVQGTDVERSKNLSTWPNQLNNTAILAFSDPTKEGTISYIPSNTSTADGNMISSAQEPDVGTSITITDSIDNNAYIVGTNWKVIGIGIRRVVNGVEEVSLRVKSWDGIA